MNGPREREVACIGIVTANRGDGLDIVHQPVERQPGVYVSSERQPARMLYTGLDKRAEEEELLDGRRRRLDLVGSEVQP
jgi:hypothetical protein